jgi:membrane protein required for colicin V production
MNAVWVDWGWVDLTLLAMVAASVLVGLWRGLVFEVLSVLGWLVAYFAAQWFAPALSPYLPIGALGSALNHAATFVAAFLLALVVWGLGARLVRMIVRAVPVISAADRLMGAAFGLVRALILLLAIATVVGLTPLMTSAAWQQSRVAVWSTELLQGMKHVLPADFYRHFPV